MFPSDAERHFFRLRGVFTARSIAVMGIMLALSALLSLFTIDITPTFRAISFTFIPASVVSILYGPWAALAFGAVSDLFNFIVRPSGVYFPGYALSAMASNFIYALLMYRRPVSIWRAVVSRVLVTAVSTFALNYLWNLILYGSAAGAFFTAARLISNAVKLPLYAFLIYVLGRLSVYAAIRYRLIDSEGSVLPGRKARE